MYKLQTQDGMHYTGRAGQYWVSKLFPAFLYSNKELAEKKAAFHNQYTGLHSLVFTVVEHKVEND